MTRDPEIIVIAILPILTSGFTPIRTITRKICYRANGVTVTSFLPLMPKKQHLYRDLGGDGQVFTHIETYLYPYYPKTRQI